LSDGQAGGEKGGPEAPREARPGRPAPGPAGPRRRLSFTLLYLALAFVLLLALSSNLEDALGTSQVSYDTFKKQVAAGRVASVVVSPEEVKAELKEKRKLPVLAGGGETKEVEVERIYAHRIPGDDDALNAFLDGHDVQTVGERDSGWGRMIVFLLLTSVVFIVGLFLLMRFMSPSRQVMSFGKSRAKVYAEKETKVAFGDVAGIEEAKEELMEVVEFLRDPTPYQRLGARIPRGILLVGPPGTGKTLLARAVAGEADVVFFSLSGSDFVEMFAGVGASRVRDLFEQAQKQAPCIVFIDELDALGKVRGVGLSGAHDEREQTLNQLLSEMDGFDPDKGVVILAATNRPEILDPALLRPGRFDRQVVVDRPDVRGREKILEIHAEKVKLGGDVDMARVARHTPGLVGADLANVVNEAALLAGRRALDAVGQAELEEAIQRQYVGLERKSRVMAPHEKERIAVHETGHALVALSVPRADPVNRVSIIARGVGALGYTMQTPSEERYVLTRGELEDRLAVMLGGRGAELLVYEDTSTGASDDLARATDLARRMVTEFGMSEAVGPIGYARHGRQRYLAPEEQGQRDFSDDTAREVDMEVRGIVRVTEQRVTELLASREAALRAIAGRLVRKEVILSEELDELARAHGAAPVDRPRPALQIGDGSDASDEGELPGAGGDGAGGDGAGDGAGDGGGDADGGGGGEPESEAAEAAARGS